MSVKQASGMKRLFISLTQLAAVWCGNALAQPLEDVRLEYQSQGVVATIRLTGPVQYLRHFPESHGKTLEIYYDRVLDATSRETWLDNEVRHSPPSSLIPSFTVTTRNQEIKCDQQPPVEQPNPRDQLIPRDQQTPCDQLTKPKLVIEFEREAEYSVAPGKDNRSLLIIIRPEKRPVSTGPLPFLPTIRPEPAAAPAGTLTPEAAAIAETNKQARALMVQGRDALSAKSNEAAVDAFNKLLLLPPNDYTQDGQEWIGVARERAEQIDKARIEYELFLRLYPEGEGAGRVAQRLAGLAGKGTGQAAVAGTEEKKPVSRLMTYGSISSRYYYGHSKIDATDTLSGQPATSLSLKDQSMLVSSLDASERYVSEDYDGRLVVRDVNTKNFLANGPSLNRLNAAYGEIKNRKQDYFLRLGRQSAVGGGVLGRFDGAFGSYGDAQSLRVNGVAGTLVDYSQLSGSKPQFVGASADTGAFSFYGINQTVDQTVDRRALGTEWRYFEGKNTAYALLDYDTYFKAVNAAQFMGTMGVSSASVNFIVDHRKNPSLSVRNALTGANTTSVEALLQTMSVSSLRDLAMARTATSNLGQIGVTVPYNEKWQVGGDIRVSNTTGLPTSGTAPVAGVAPAPEGYLAAVPGRGTEKGVTAQVIGSGVLKAGDIWSGSVTITTGSAAKGQSIYLYNHTPFGSSWMLDTSLQMYNQTDQFGGTTKRISPMVRGSYRFRERLTFDADCGYESIKSSGATQTTDIARFFYSAGLRWDF